MTNRPSEQLYLAGSFSWPSEAHLAKSRLEDEGIRCYIANEYTISANWLYSNVLGGVKVYVEWRDINRAKMILSQDDSHLVADQLPQPDVDTTESSDSLQEQRRAGYRNRGLLSLLLWHIPVIGHILWQFPFPIRQGPRTNDDHATKRPTD